MEYTKGPWVVNENDYKNSYGIECKVNGVGHTIATDQFCYPNFKDGKTPEKLANAKLMAAAPDLLEALRVIEFLHDAVFSDTAPNKQGVLYAFNHAEITYEDLRKAKAAIIKATI